MMQFENQFNLNARTGFIAVALSNSSGTSRWKSDSIRKEYYRQHMESDVYTNLRESQECGQTKPAHRVRCPHEYILPVVSCEWSQQTFWAHYWWLYPHQVRTDRMILFHVARKTRTGILDDNVAYWFKFCGHQGHSAFFRTNVLTYNGMQLFCKFSKYLFDILGSNTLVSTENQLQTYTRCRKI